MMKLMFCEKFAAMLCSVLMLCSIANAGDVEAGKKKSMVCGSCHGALGLSSNELWPNLAGQQPQYLIKQLREFREGVRNDPWMSPMAKPLSDEDIEDLAAFYSNIK